MSPIMRRRSPMRRSSEDRSGSPVRDRSSTRRRRSPINERSPIHRKSSPRMRSPVKTNSSHRTRSPTKEKLPERARSPRVRSPIRGRLPGHARSPRSKHSRSPAKEKVPDHTGSSKHARSTSPVKPNASRSPSPRTKRLRRAQTGQETENTINREHERNNGRDYDKGRRKEEGDNRDDLSQRRLMRDKSDGGSSRSSRRERSISPGDRNHRSRYSSRSPPRGSKAGARDEVLKSRGAEELGDDDHDSLAKMKAAEEALETKQKQKPSFELSGKLAEETNRVRGVTLLFSEPPEARKPDVRWRLYVFKAGEVLNEPLYVHRQSCYLFGRERRVADIPTDHPSCSKQHAVIQYRLVEKEQSNGSLSKQVRPYLMDLGSTNGTFINDNRVEPQRYYELIEKDTIRFGNSSREYVMLHENSSD